ncbi:protein-tyrosine phosphatase-like protein [Baffinella frigidus]|nr:protein-tyrosine phosphatase-like protein [Cryptophyta sp. CCMP2293]
MKRNVGQAFRQREWRTYDGNFVPPDLNYQDIPPNLAIGPYPQCEEDVILMKERGITGVINVQTDDDHRFRMINWELMTGFYAKHGISVRRIPILDFNGDELARLVKVASDGCHELVQEAYTQGKAPRVYIHCTAGMGRAPAVACVYLVLHQGFNLGDALAHCKAHRNVCAPNWSAMENALRHA